MYGRLSTLLTAHARSTSAIRNHQLRHHRTAPATSRPTITRQFSDPSKRRGL